MEAKVKQIIVGFDFSPGSIAAYRSAVNFARLSGASVRVVTATPGAVSTFTHLMLGDHAKHNRDDYRAEANYLQQIEDLVKQSIAHEPHGDVNVGFDVGELAPLEQILQSTTSYDGDLIVMGEMGLNPDPSRRVGFTTERLIRRSMQPVLINDREHPFPPKKILVPVDFSEASERAFGWAVGIAQKTGASIEVLHSVELESEPVLTAYRFSYKVGFSEELEKTAREAIEGLLRRFDISGVNVHYSVFVGSAYSRIVTTAKEGGHDLIVIGTVGRSELEEQLIGGTAERVIRSLPCSILAVKPDSHALHVRRGHNKG